MTFEKQLKINPAIRLGLSPRGFIMGLTLKSGSCKVSHLVYDFIENLAIGSRKHFHVRLMVHNKLRPS